MVGRLGGIPQALAAGGAIVLLIAAPSQATLRYGDVKATWQF